MRRIALLTVVGLAVGCKGAERPATPITTRIVLRYHPPAGAVYHYVMDQTSSFGPDSGADTGGVNSLRIAFTQKIGTPEAGGVPVTVTFDSTGGSRAAPRAPPAHPVGPGDSWTNEMQLPVSAIGGTPFTVHTTVTVREISVSRGDTTVRLEVETALPAEPMQFAFGGQQFTVALKGAITGEQTLSLTRGAVVSAALGGTMHVGISGGFFGAPGLKARVQQQGTLKLVS